MKTAGLISSLNMAFDRIIGVCAFVAGVLAIVLMLIVTYDVIMGYFFNSPTVWASEISGYILVFSPFLAGAWILKNDRHVKLDFLMERLNERNQLILGIFIGLVTMAVCAVIFWFGVQSVRHHLQINFLTPTLLMWPKWMLMTVIPFGFLTLLIESLRGLVRRISKLVTYSEIKSQGAGIGQV